MGHPNLSDRINDIVDGQLMYDEMRLGEILEITALGAETKLPGVIRLQVVHIEKEGDGHKAPIFRFLDTEISLFGDDRATPVRPKKGDLAGPGISAMHVPNFVLGMLGFGGIGAGRDYSFEYVGGKGNFLYAARIGKIVRHAPPKGWREPKTAVARYKNMVERIRRAEEERQKEHELMLKKALIIRTANSTYTLTAADEGGVRDMTRNGEGAPQKAKLLAAKVGGPMLADVETTPKNWQALQTSTIVSIDVTD
ncbi:MAG: hypothetical protein WC551_03055 [Patescibacteria group bacterium]